MTNRRIVFSTTERTNLVHIEKADAAISVRWFNDARITQHLGHHDWPMQLSDSEKYYANAYTNRDQLVLGIQHKVSKALIGTTGLHNIHRTNQTAVFGIVIGDVSFHKQGLGREVVNIMCDLAFKRLKLRSVTLQVLASNPHAVTCYRACGFEEVGRLPQHLFRDGVFVDEITMCRWRDGRPVSSENVLQ